MAGWNFLWFSPALKNPEHEYEKAVVLLKCLTYIIYKQCKSFDANDVEWCIMKMVRDI